VHETSQRSLWDLCSSTRLVRIWSHVCTYCKLQFTANRTAMIHFTWKQCADTVSGNKCSSRHRLAGSGAASGTTQRFYEHHPWSGCCLWECSVTAFFLALSCLSCSPILSTPSPKSQSLSCFEHQANEEPASVSTSISSRVGFYEFRTPRSGAFLIRHFP